MKQRKRVANVIESRIPIFDCAVFSNTVLFLESIALMKFSLLEIAGFAI